MTSDLTTVVSGFLNELNDTYKLAVTVFLLVITLLGCFFGYKLSRLFMSLTGFLTGIVLGNVISSHFLHTQGTATALVLILCGALVAALSFYIYRIGIFILCFGLAFAAGSSFFPFTGDLQFFLCILTGLVTGVLAVKFMRPVIILSSAIVCGSCASGLLPSADKYLGLHILPSMSTLGTFGLCFILCVLGILFQFFTTKEPGKKHRHKHSA